MARGEDPRKDFGGNREDDEKVTFFFKHEMKLILEGNSTSVTEEIKTQATAEQEAASEKGLSQSIEIVNFHCLTF